MRHIVASFEAFLAPLTAIVAILEATLPVRGADVPFTEHVISATAFGAQSVFAMDLDGDGDIDVLSASTFESDDKIMWYENDGGSPPMFTARLISDSAIGSASVFATDVDTDGDIDVLSASVDDNKIAWYESDGGSPPTFTERVISTAADGALSVFAIDLDRDGDTDCLSASAHINTIAWYESDGGLPPMFTAHVISATATTAASVFATDVDGDGHTDVLSASVNDHTIAWYESDGGSPPTFSERVISMALQQPITVFATDIDADGDTDVVGGGLAGKIAWYDNDGGSPPIFTERAISTTANQAWSVFAADMDADGDVDVLLASRGGPGKVAWYESDGASPPNFGEHIISTVTGGSSVYAVDVDSDGDTDVLSALMADENMIAWYENTMPRCVDGCEECDPKTGLPTISDTDGDGICNAIDTEPSNPSNSFSDGTTTGEIADRADQILTVTDLLPNLSTETGVRISADVSGGPQRALINTCLDPPNARVKLGAEDIFEYTCGSVSIAAVSGSLEVELAAENGGTATLILTQGNAISFDETTFLLTVPESNTQTVVVAINGVETPLEPGDTYDGNIAFIPATSQWGLALMAMLVLVAGTVVLRRVAVC